MQPLHLKSLARIRRLPSSLILARSAFHSVSRLHITNNRLTELTIPQSRKFFSFFPTAERTDAVSQETWLRVSTNLTATKAGSMSRVKWHEAFEALEYWTKQRTKLGLTWSWRLMDRLVDEEAYVVVHKPNEELLLTQKHFAMVIQNWSRSLNVLPAKTVLDRLDFYTTLIPHFEPNTRILGTLIVAALKKHDPHILDLVETVLDRLEANAADEKHPLSDPDIAAIGPAIRATSLKGYSDSPGRADAILARLEKLATWDMTPDTMKGRIMSNLAKSAHPGAALKVEGMLKDLVEPTTAGYLAVLQAWSRSDEPGAADRCYAILNHMKLQERIKVTAWCYTPVIRAFGREQRPQEAEAVLQDLLNEYERTKDPDLMPSVFPFNALIYAWSTSGAIDAGMRAENLLRRMADLAKTTENPRLEPDKVSFTAVISAWAHSQHIAGAERAQQILHHMEELHQKGNDAVKPDGRAYSVAMEAWQYSGSKNAVENTKALFNKQIAQYEAGDFDMKPNMRTYVVLLETFARYKVNPERLEGIIREMQERADAGDPAVNPTSANYKCVMNAWASSYRKDAPERMDALLQVLHKNGRKADRQMYGKMLHLWAVSNSPIAARKADSILETMKKKWSAGEESVDPSIRIYNLVLKAWANSRSSLAPRRAHAIITEICDRWKEGNEHLKPTTITFNHALTCCMRSNPGLAHSLLEEMIALYKSGLTECIPDETSYNIVMCAWSRSMHDRRISQAANVFQRMEFDRDGLGVRPNCISFGHMIHACFSDRGKEVRSAAIAAGYLEKLINLCEVDKAFRPTACSFNQVIVLLLESSQPHTDEYALHLMDKMETMESAGDIIGPKDSIHYSTLISALARSNVSQKYSRIHTIMKNAERFGINVNAGTLHNVLEACGASSNPTSDDDKIILIKESLAQLTFYRAYTFLLVFKALSSMRGRESDVRNFYRMCVEHGHQHSEYILTAYHDALMHNTPIYIGGGATPL